MKELSLRPYPGKVIVCKTLKELRTIYTKHTRRSYPYQDQKTGGRFIRLEGRKVSDFVWLVYGQSPHTLAHEFTHVLLHLFELIGAEPGGGNGEPFCYMLSQLMLEAQ